MTVAFSHSGTYSLVGGRDLDGDGKTDIAVNGDKSGTWGVLDIVHGVQPAVEHELSFSSRAGLMLADTNQDGYADLMLSTFENQSGWVPGSGAGLEFDKLKTIAGP